MEADGVEDGPKPQNYITPAFSGRRSKVEFAEQSSRGGLFGVTLLYSQPGQAVERLFRFGVEQLRGPHGREARRVADGRVGRGVRGGVGGKLLGGGHRSRTMARGR